jgi:hypothetical protein
MELIRALIEARKEFTPVAKKHKAEAGKFSYSYAGLEDVMAMIEAPLSKNGLLIVHETTATECATVLYHESGASIRCSLPIKGNTPQVLGAELSYMRRYGVSSLLAIVTEDDDDGGRAEVSATTKNRAQAAANAPQRRVRAASAQEEGKGLAALWAQTYATGKALGLDKEGSEQLMRDYLADYETESTKDLSADQLKQLRQKLKKLEEDNTPDG